MALYGYARVSTADQDCTLQEHALRAAGCEVIRAEKVSATRREGRTELALRSEIPDWCGLAAFRCITDFSVPLDLLDTVYPPRPNPVPRSAYDRLKTANQVGALEDVWAAYDLFFEHKDTLHSGKLQLRGEAEAHFLQNLSACQPIQRQPRNLRTGCCCWFGFFGDLRLHIRAGNLGD